MLKGVILVAAASSGCLLSLLEILHDRQRFSINKLAHLYRNLALASWDKDLFLDPALHQCLGKPPLAKVSNQF
jgi:hypothetical protein